MLSRSGEAARLRPRRITRLRRFVLRVRTRRSPPLGVRRFWDLRRGEAGREAAPGPGHPRPDHDFARRGIVWSHGRGAVPGCCSPVRCAHGTGAAEGSRPITCPQCNGQGAVQAARRTVLGTMMSVVECDRCHGVGTIVESPCSTLLRGPAQSSAIDRCVVEVPEGVADGTRLRLSGNGEAGQTRRPGRRPLRRDPGRCPTSRFERNGDDLIYRAEVGIAEAALGSSVDVPLLGGRQHHDRVAGRNPTEHDVLAAEQGDASPRPAGPRPDAGGDQCRRPNRSRRCVRSRRSGSTHRPAGKSVETPRRWRKARSDVALLSATS